MDECLLGTRQNRGMKAGKEGAKRWSGAGRNLFVEDAQSVHIRRVMAKPRSIRDLAPAGSAIEHEGDHFGYLFEDFCQGF